MDTPIFSIEQLGSLTKPETETKDEGKQQDNQQQQEQAAEKGEQQTSPDNKADNKSDAVDNKNEHKNNEQQSQQVDIEAVVEERIKQLKESGEFIDKSTYEQSLAEREIKNDLIKKLAELDKGTGKVNKDFLRQYLTDWDSYDVSNSKQASSLLVNKLMQKEGYDKETAELELENKYPMLFEEDPDTESKEYQRQVKLAQHEAKQFIAENKKQQESLALSDPEVLAETSREKVIEDYEKQKISKQKEIFDAWSDYSDLVVSNLDKQTYEVGDNKFDITFSEEEKQAVKNLISNTPKLPDLFFKEGKLDEAAYKKFIINGLMADKIIESIAKDAIAIGESKRFKETKSATTTSTNIIPTNGDKSKDVKAILSKHGIPV